MPIYKRENGVYYIDITTQSGQRIRQSSRTKDKSEAQRLHDKLKHELWQQEHFNENRNDCGMKRQFGGLKRWGQEKYQG